MRLSSATHFPPPAGLLRPYLRQKKTSLALLWRVLVHLVLVVHLVVHLDIHLVDIHRLVDIHLLVDIYLLVSNPLSRQQLAGLPRPRCPTGKREFRSALKESTGRSLPPCFTHSSPAIANDKEIIGDPIGFDLSVYRLCRCVYKKALCPRYRPPRSKNLGNLCLPSATFRSTVKFGEVAKIMAPDW